MSQLKFRGRGAMLKARQPPIYMLGKHTPVDEDEPPDVPVQAFGFETESESSSSFVTTFDATDAEDASKFLRKTFKILQPGYHASKRMPEMDGGYFSHCPRGVPLGQQYSNLCMLVEERAQLELLKDCLLRVKSVQIFVEDLESLVHMECRTAYAIRHGTCIEMPVTKLYCLNALCEDLRLHVAHWNSIKQRLNTNHWLHHRLGQLCLQLQYIMQTLTSAVLRAVCNLDLLIHIGFEVFAHCNMETASHEIMWNITRGLEDFNIIVNGLKLNYQVNRSHIFGMDYISTINNGHLCLSTSPLLKPLRIIPFTKVLSILATERSRFAAKLTHQFFTCNENFIHLVNAGSLPAFDWWDHLPHQNQPHSMIIGSDTSDYHTLTASSTSISAGYLNAGSSVKAPDLSESCSSLIQFSQKEQEFAESFLLIACNSTSLLRKNEPQKPHRSHHGNKQTDLKSPISPVVGRPPRVQFQGDTPVMNRTDSQRKTVSWVDNADNTIRSAVVAHYMDSMWTQLGRNLDLILDEPAWVGRNCLLHSEMGSILLFSDTVIAVLRNMIDHVCFKNLFPPASIQPLLGVVFRLHALSAYGAWDIFVCASLASETADKCQPCFLTGDNYSTRTGLILRDMYSPLMSMLHEICGCFPQNIDNTSQHASVDLGLCAGLTWRVLTTCKLALSWCSLKVQQLLSSWNVQQFLFLTHSDLKGAEMINLWIDCEDDEESVSSGDDSDDNSDDDSSLSNSDSQEQVVDTDISSDDEWASPSHSIVRGPGKGPVHKKSQFGFSGQQVTPGQSSTTFLYIISSTSSNCTAMDQQILTTNASAQLLVDCTKNLSCLLQSLNFHEEHFIVKVADNLSVCQIMLLLHQIDQVNGQMQSLSSTSIKSFIEKYSIYALNFFQENLLPGRIWKRKLSPEEAADPSSYTISAVETLLLPIVHGISKLSTTSQIGVMSLVTVAFCNSWLSIIMKEKIRFSLWGAVQLGIDFEYVKTQLHQLLINEEVRHSVSDLAIFQQMRGIIILLKRQPSQKQSGSRLMENIMCDSASSVPSSDLPTTDTRANTSTPASTCPTVIGNGMHKSSKTGAQLTQEEEDVHTVPNVQEWLALRTIGGSKPWKFPACFSRSSSDD